MTYEETLKIFAVLKANYSNFFKNLTRIDAEAQVNLWSEMFDEPYELVGAAVKAYIATDTDGYPPNVGKIKEYIRKLTQSEEMTELEAWTCVQKALRNSLYNSASEFEKLPPIVQRLVGSHNQLREWAMMDSDTVNSVVSSNFQRSYKARAKSEKEYLALPTELKSTIEKLASGMTLDRLTGSEEILKLK